MKRYLRFSVASMLVFTAIIAAYFGGYRSGQESGYKAGFDVGFAKGQVALEVFIRGATPELRQELFGEAPSPNPDSP